MNFPGTGARKAALCGESSTVRDSISAGFLYNKENILVTLGTTICKTEGGTRMKKRLLALRLRRLPKQADIISILSSTSTVGFAI